MYKKIVLFFAFVFSCFLSSCRTTRQETSKTETTTQLTSEKVVIYKDTTVFAPKAETNLKIPLSELVFKNPLNIDSKPIVYTQKNGQAKVKLKIVHDTIQVTATCDSLAIVAKIKSEFQKQIKSEKTANTEQSKQRTDLSFWTFIQAIWLGTVIVAIAIFAFKIIKP